MTTAKPLPYATPAALQRKWAAAYCGVSVDTFDKAVRPHLRCRYVEGVRVWLTRDLDAYLDRCPAEVA